MLSSLTSATAELQNPYRPGKRKYNPDVRSNQTWVGSPNLRKSRNSRLETVARPDSLRAGNEKLRRRQGSSTLLTEDTEQQVASRDMGQMLMWSGQHGWAPVRYGQEDRTLAEEWYLRLRAQLPFISFCWTTLTA